MAGLGNWIGFQRARAIWQVVALLVYATIGWVLALIAFAAALIWMVIDVIIRFIFNRGGADSGRTSMAAMWLKRLYKWHHDLLDYILFGNRPFPWPNVMP